MNARFKNTPRIRLYSDLHLEMKRNHSLLDVIPRDTDADLVLLAGDIANGADGVRWAAEWFRGVPVAYVLGNHEAYGHDLNEVYAACHEASAGTSVRVLERATWDVFPGVRIVGATLWTDFCLWGPGQAAEAEIEALRMSDFGLIRMGERRLRPDDTKRLHSETRAWLTDELARAAADRLTTIVVTHHAPHEACLANRHVRLRDPLSPAFATDLSELMLGPNAPATWCSGHTHHNHGGIIDSTRLAANMAGYLFHGEGVGFVPEGLLISASS